MAKEIGQEPCNGCSIGKRQHTIKVGKGKLTAVTLFSFDTVANQAQGRIVDAKYPLVISLWLLVDSLTELMNAILLASSNLIR